MDKNPQIVQPEDWSPGGSGYSVPAFLIHDGGGTTFAYHCLNPISRLVYGIHNPNFSSGEPFDGGITEMARLYCGFIKNAIREPEFPKRRNADGKVRLLLGGWSLGGLLSLEMAKQLDKEDSGVEVIGILMVDSVYPVKRFTTAPANVSEEGKRKNEILSDRAMVDARRMIQHWTPPVWDGDSAGQRPRTTMLRANKSVPDQRGELVDGRREERNLGWDAHEKDMFAQVVDVEGHHFELFSFENIEGISEAIKKALVDLEHAALRA
ncbi:hypothetical protein FZEAL_2399 [Fusarium zealandicum]|uniref:Thioesterase domain-containing protein n=1 Tax=Fusarium zealandicum TaxID=1053134 RepID=A0A8H4XNH4_9HYPO|nr:hypothetical protein FZEAL_2399 [Fusarium zealandicum]